MKTGLYKVEFRTPRGHGAGVIALEGGKVRGGDSTFYFSGDYQEAGGQVTANVHVKRHSQGGVALLGENVSATLQGKIAGDAAQLKGTVAGTGSAHFEVHLKYLSD